MKQIIKYYNDLVIKLGLINHFISLLPFLLYLLLPLLLYIILASSVLSYYYIIILLPYFSHLCYNNTSSFGIRNPIRLLKPWLDFWLIKKNYL